MRRWTLVAVALGTAAEGKIKAPTPPTYKGSPAVYFSPDFYPPSAIRNGEEGRVVATLSVGADGIVTDCTIATSSGSAALDEATCLGGRKVLFTPAHDRRGRAIASTAKLPVRWVLPTDVPADAPSAPVRTP